MKSKIVDKKHLFFKTILFFNEINSYLHCYQQVLKFHFWHFLQHFWRFLSGYFGITGLVSLWKQSYQIARSWTIAVRITVVEKCTKLPKLREIGCSISWCCVLADFFPSKNAFFPKLLGQLQILKTWTYAFSRFFCAVRKKETFSQAI